MPFKNPHEPSTMPPPYNRIKFMGNQCSPVRRTVSQWSASCNPAHVNLHAIYTHARVVRVSLADCWALGGKGTGGLKTPGYPKTVLRTENKAAAPRPFGYRLFNNATLHVNPHAKIAHAMGCQGQSCRLFCPWGQGRRGFNPPRLFEDRPADGKRSGCAAPFWLSPF